MKKCCFVSCVLIFTIFICGCGQADKPQDEKTGKSGLFSSPPSCGGYIKLLIDGNGKEWKLSEEEFDGDFLIDFINLM